MRVLLVRVSVSSFNTPGGASEVLVFVRADLWSRFRWGTLASGVESTRAVESRLEATTMFETEKKHIETILKGLRPKVTPKTPDLEILAEVLRGGGETCSPETLAKFARSKKRFTTADVMQHFSVGKYKVAGALAALRRAGKIEPGPVEEKNGYSIWTWVA
jgi:hypothetical protein